MDHPLTIDADSSRDIFNYCITVLIIIILLLLYCVSCCRITIKTPSSPEELNLIPPVAEPPQPALLGFLRQG